MQSGNLQKIVTLIKKYFDTIETIFSLIFAIGTVLLFMNGKGFNVYFFNIFIWTGAGALAILYFLRGYEQVEGENILLKILDVKFYWLALSTAIIGIAGILFMWPSADLMIYIGLITGFISIIAKLFLKLKFKENIPNGDFIRFLLIALIAVIVLSF